MAYPLLKWPGGKRWLASKIANCLIGTFERYLEPFIGGGALLFALEPKNGIASDINTDLIACYQAVQKDSYRVLSAFRQLKSERAEYYRIRDQWLPASEFEQAARFIYLLRHSWNGLYRVNLNGHFNVPYCPRPRKDQLSEDQIIRAQEILRRVSLQHCPFETVISIAGEGDLIFADPPYFENGHQRFGKYSTRSFSEKDQEQLCNALTDAAERGASWILTNGSLKRLKYFFGKYQIFMVSRYSSIAANPKFRGQVQEFVVLSSSERLELLRTFLEKTQQAVSD